MTDEKQPENGPERSHPGVAEEHPVPEGGRPEEIPEPPEVEKNDS